MEKKEVFRKSSVERISSPEQLNDYIRVIKPSVVLLTGALVLLLVGAVIWGIAGTIPVTVSEKGAFYQTENGGSCDQMVCVLTAEAAGKLKEGMEVQVSPDTASRDTYGYVKGSIDKISQYPVSLEEIEDLVQNETLAHSIMPEGNVGMMVTVKLESDSESENHLAWSNKKGNQVKVTQGMTGNALVVIKNQKPIDLVLSSEGE